MGVNPTLADAVGAALATSTDPAAADALALLAVLEAETLALDLDDDEIRPDLDEYDPDHGRNPYRGGPHDPGEQDDPDWGTYV